jgi:hypothetical protein
MKKITKKIATILVLIMLASPFTGCAAMALVVLAPVAQVAVETGTEIVGAIHDSVEAARFKKAAETVIQYDEVDSF